MSEMSVTKRISRAVVRGLGAWTSTSIVVLAMAVLVFILGFHSHGEESIVTRLLEGATFTVVILVLGVPLSIQIGVHYAIKRFIRELNFGKAVVAGLIEEIEASTSGAVSIEVLHSRVKELCDEVERPLLVLGGRSLLNYLCRSVLRRFSKAANAALAFVLDEQKDDSIDEGAANALGAMIDKRIAQVASGIAFKMIGALISLAIVVCLGAMLIWSAILN